MTNPFFREKLSPDKLLEIKEKVNNIVSDNDAFVIAKEYDLGVSTVRGYRNLNEEKWSLKIKRAEAQKLFEEGKINEVAYNNQLRFLRNKPKQYKKRETVEIEKNEFAPKEEIIEKQPMEKSELNTEEMLVNNPEEPDETFYQDYQKTKKGKKVVGPPTAPIAIRRQNEKEVIDEATNTLNEIATYGKFCRNYIGEFAYSDSKSIPQFITDAVSFYMENRGKIEKVNAQKEIYKTIIIKVLKIIKEMNTNEYKANKLQEMIMAHKMAKLEPPQEIMDAYLKLLNDEKSMPDFQMPEFAQKQNI